MKQYTLHIKCQISDRATTYPVVSPIDFSITENLPPDVDAETYARKRLAEELKRAFASSPTIENFSDDAKRDPLGGDTL